MTGALALVLRIAVDSGARVRLLIRIEGAAADIGLASAIGSTSLPAGLSGLTLAQSALAKSCATLAAATAAGGSILSLTRLASLTLLESILANGVTAGEAAAAARAAFALIAA